MMATGVLVALQLTRLAFRIGEQGAEVPAYAPLTDVLLGKEMIHHSSIHFDQH